MLAPAVLDPSHLFQHLGYAAILVIVLLGNAGVPAPEESVLVLGGYLAWHGRLHLPLVILVGVVSASLGDNLGYWAGRHYGRRAVARLPLPPARLAQAQGLIARYGARAVFAARFVPGLRTVAGPLAGSGGLPPLRFFAANLLGAICYVPWPVLAGYGVGYGLGNWVERLRRAVGLKEDVALFAAILALAGLAFIATAWARHRGAARPGWHGVDTDQ
jgi:membrane protein DedA with SNARE-associated domain